ncbi:hypothetical protein DAPPUDRAFT_249276 [Daphnia pulex]|uniref:Uncharacterized protein n=1 Tax=Daphnia pulex TaxID=6669 RepID=E9GWB6_DAPPU|nr:hypothetical protein DAPPUDRAFT_249276 [Daphnia pulex]|eukprot:EFX76222.1 hypothetical protein DAPPUDRAFT_249276 [Daphnia pulex]
MSKGANNPKADLVQTHTEVENVKKELNELKENTQLNPTSAQMLASVMATVENMKKEMITKTDLAQTTQLLDDVTTTHCFKYWLNAEIL